MLGEAHPSTLSSVNNLGSLLRDQGRLDEARPLYEEALLGRRATLGEAHLDTLASGNNLADLLFAQGRLEEALLMLEQVLAGYKVTLGECHPYAQYVGRGVEMLRKKLDAPSMAR